MYTYTHVSKTLLFVRLIILQGRLSVPTFRKVEAFVRRELNDDDYLGRNKLEREAAASIAQIVDLPSPRPASAQALTDSADDMDDEENESDLGRGGVGTASASGPTTATSSTFSSGLTAAAAAAAALEDRQARERKGGPLIHRDKFKDKNFEFNGVPCLLLSLQTESKKPWICKFDNCNKVFLSKDKLIRHSLIHSGGKPFECFVCQRAFNDQANLNNHMRTQHFYCSTCKQQFASRREIEDHAHDRHQKSSSKRAKMSP